MGGGMVLCVERFKRTLNFMKGELQQRERGKVTKEDRGKGFARERDYKDIDGLITDEKGLVLATFYADCVPLFFVDKVRQAIGLTHSGWRGTVGKIGKKTVEMMIKEYGTNPRDLVAAIGPSICVNCYEVSEDVVYEFRKVFTCVQVERFLKEGKHPFKYQLDLWEANRMIMEEAGILPENIAMPGICTCCNPEFLYSHRASNGKRGNLGAFLMLKNKI
jgi:YfiH family protein